MRVYFFFVDCIFFCVKWITFHSLTLFHPSGTREIHLQLFRQLPIISATRNSYWDTCFIANKKERIKSGNRQHCKTIMCYLCLFVCWSFSSNCFHTRCEAGIYQGRSTMPCMHMFTFTYSFPPRGSLPTCVFLGDGWKLENLKEIKHDHKKNTLNSHSVIQAQQQSLMIAV